MDDRRQGLGRAVRRLAEDLVRTALRVTPPSRPADRGRPDTPVPRPAPQAPPRPRSGAQRGTGTGTGTPVYPGDFTGRPVITYRPREDGRPDPGEVVWTWVPFEEDATRGKDRPVLLIGADGPWLLGLQLTSKDHDRDAAQEASVGRYWLDIGAGPWDHEGRPSEVRLNRIIRIDPDTVRRTAARLDERRFHAVAEGVLAHC
ncbi:type II toxin-antitoxin system PemK/MazF family toxin [Raineyella fluvialis]|uniref:Type II toxin-antitoxin system PemK/MazF family toxin n=1 Tax=Raineyella fluvialis TaxID=2662261 RepID=A0A5Q2F9Q9_9ACTN|nr:type II toxin-antitoxin system PemK/MazF family toxin [Raineyella fluvialis]QGF23632.1 type II toxin-antitoxin system PemK/MazF family toxin [Raineyella fluvialis]